MCLFTPPQPTIEYCYGPDGRTTESHLGRNLKGTTIEAGLVVLLGNEDTTWPVGTQTAFESAENMTIQGGFFGINAPKAAAEYSKIQAEIQKENISLKRRQTELEFGTVHSLRLFLRNPLTRHFSIFQKS